MSNLPPFKENREEYLINGLLFLLILFSLGLCYFLASFI
jgi:hypothetical protein